jgi:flagellar capping protein FliD
MATENKESAKKTGEEYMTELLKNPVATFAGGALGGFLISLYQTDKKIEKVEKGYGQQIQKREEQFNRLMEQMAISNSRQDKLLEAFALHSGQSIEGHEAEGE